MRERTIAILFVLLFDIPIVIWHYLKALYMAIGLVELAIGIAIGVAIGIAILYAVMQSRVTKRAQQISFSMYEQQKQQLENMMRDQYNAAFDKWKAEYEPSVLLRIDEAKKQALEQSRFVLKGKIGEQMAPLLPEFISKYEPSDARFIGTPVDYIIFKNMSKSNDGSSEPIEIVLLDVKTGTSSLNKVQRMIRESVESARVRFETLRPKIDTSLAITDNPETVESIKSD